MHASTTKATVSHYEKDNLFTFLGFPLVPRLRGYDGIFRFQTLFRSLRERLHSLKAQNFGAIE